jgi:hypothetical protein
VRGRGGLPLLVAASAIVFGGADAWGRLPGGPAAAAPATGEEDPSYLPQMLMVAGIVVIALTITRLVRRRVTSRADHRAPPRERLEAIKADAHTRAVREHPEGLVDSATAASELAVMLDNRAMRVEQLIRDADERLARLEGAVGAVGAVGATDADPGHDASRADPSRIHELAAADQAPSAIARELGIPLDEVRRILADGTASPPTGDSP